MANEKRLRANSIGGLIEDNPLTNSATTLTSAALAALLAVDSTGHCAIVLDPDGVEGVPEIVWVTAHTAAATTATILRAQEGTGALQHSQGIPWVHAPTIKDYDGSGGGAGLIGLKEYFPGSAAVISTSSAAFSNVDATNLVVSFVAPPSGKVLGRLTARGYSATGEWLHWGVHNGTADIASSDAQVTPSNNRIAHSFLVTGLTPGTTYTWTWRHKNEGAGAVNTIYGGASGSALMEVWAVNV